MPHNDYATFMPEYHLLFFLIFMSYAKPFNKCALQQYFFRTSVAFKFSSNVQTSTIKIINARFLTSLQHLASLATPLLGLQFFYDMIMVYFLLCNKLIVAENMY